MSDKPIRHRCGDWAGGEPTVGRADRDGPPGGSIS
jgi:hypothetical protein